MKCTNSRALFRLMILEAAYFRRHMRARFNAQTAPTLCAVKSHFVSAIFYEIWFAFTRSRFSFNWHGRLLRARTINLKVIFLQRCGLMSCYLSVLSAWTARCNPHFQSRINCVRWRTSVYMNPTWERITDRSDKHLSDYERSANPTELLLQLIGDARGLLYVRFKCQRMRCSPHAPSWSS